MVFLGDLFWYLYAYYLKDAGPGLWPSSNTALSAAGSRTQWTIKVWSKDIIRFACLCSLRTCFYPHEVNAFSLLLIFLPSVLPDVVRTGKALHPPPLGSKGTSAQELRHCLRVDSSFVAGGLCSPFLKVNALVHSGVENNLHLVQWWFIPNGLILCTLLYEIFWNLSASWITA